MFKPLSKPMTCLYAFVGISALANSFMTLLMLFGATHTQTLFVTVPFLLVSVAKLFKTMRTSVEVLNASV